MITICVVALGGCSIVLYVVKMIRGPVFCLLGKSQYDFLKMDLLIENS